MGIHIILFLKPNTIIDYSKLINDMYDNYKEIGKGIIIDTKRTDINQPKFIFNSNKDLLIDGNNHYIALNIFDSYETIKQDIIEMLWDAFDMNDLEFNRLGYIKEIIKKPNEFNLENFKENMFKNKEVLVSDEFQLAYHKLIKYKHETLNCWKRYLKFNNKDLIINYDINTISNADYVVTYKYVKEFMQFSEEFIINDMEGLI